MREKESSNSEGLTRSTTNTSTTPVTEEPAPRQTLNTKKSLRKLTRSTPVNNDHDAPIPAMKKPSVQPAVQPRKSSTSLFNLFSKPKVEKARGYGGEGPTSSAVVTKTPSAPLKSALKTTQPPLPRPVSTQKEAVPNVVPRAASAMSVRPHFEPATVRRDDDRWKESKSGPWIPPPLFQAFARSVKHGLAEITTNSIVERTVPARPKTAHKDGRSSMESENSSDTKTTKMTVKSSGNTFSTHVEVPQKIIVLLDTGHLLQYCQHGPSNRLPEKILPLCPDSAAMTCDMASSNQFALRVIQSVAQKSFSLAHTFSRLTRRSANTKRDAQSLVIVFGESQEMEDWTRAIRTKIAELCQPVASTPTQDTPTESKVDSVIGEYVYTSLPSPPQPQERDLAPPTIALPTVPDRRASLAPLSPPPRQTSFDITYDDDSDRKGSLEALEEEAEKLVSTCTSAVLDPSMDKRISDAPSYASSNTDQHTLNGLRNSARMSHISNGTGLTSRTSSLTSEPSSSKPSTDTATDGVLSKSPYRSLSSYQPSKRRSVMPVVPSTSQPSSELTSPTASLLAQASSTMKDSSPVSAVSTSGTQMLTALPEVRVSERPTDATPPIVEEDERPQSIITDLPPPSTWSSKLSPKNRHSFVAQPMTERQMQRMSSAPALQGAASQEHKTSRRASQAFRMPLKINPDTPATRPPSRNKSNRNTFSPDASLGEPQVFTLEAKVDPRAQRMSMGSATYSSAEMRARSAQRLSLFPSPLLVQENFLDGRPHLHSTQTAGPGNVPPRRASLQRPVSLQVRTDRAPFVSSIRNSISSSPPNNDRVLSSPASTSAPPIRSLKPSRSSPAIPSMQPVKEHHRPASPTDPFQSGKPFDYGLGVYVPRRQSYMPKRLSSPEYAPPLAPLPTAPAIPMGNSFAQQRSAQRHSYMPRTSMMGSLPTLDFGIPTAGLGPPAPPPNAPLPAPPGGAPPGIVSPMTLATRRPSTVSAAPASRSGSVSAQGNGLGIQVAS